MTDRFNPENNRFQPDSKQGYGSEDVPFGNQPEHTPSSAPQPGGAEKAQEGYAQQQENISDLTQQAKPSGDQQNFSNASLGANYDQRGYDANSGYGQPSYKQPNYGQASYPQASQAPQYGTAINPYAPDHPQSTTVLILGIISLIVFQPLGIVTVIMGNKARKEIKQNPGAYGKSTMLTVGWGLGIAATVLFCLAVVVLIVTILLAIMGSTNY